MKTRSLANRLVGTRSEQVRQSLTALLSLPEEIRDAVPDLAINRRETSRPYEAATLLDEAATNLGAPHSTLVQALNATDIIIAALLPGLTGETDSVPDIVDDLDAAGLLDEVNRNAVVAWLHRLEEATRTHAEPIRSKNFSVSSGSANLSHVHGVVDVRGVFPFAYNVNMEKDRAEATNCLGTIPVALITLILQDSPIEGVHFQVDSSRLDYLISELELLKLRMVSLTKYLNLSEPSWKTK